MAFFSGLAMLYETGHVRALQGHWIQVETLRRSACQQCAVRSGCGQGLLSSLPSGKRHYVSVNIARLTDKPRIGDLVELAIDERTVLAGALLVYGVPLLLMLAGAILARLAGQAEWLAIAGAAGGLLLAMCLLRVHARVQQHNPVWRPVFSRILAEPSAACAVNALSQ